MLQQTCTGDFPLDQSSNCVHVSSPMAMLLQRGTLEQPTFSAGRSNRAVYGILKPCSRQFAVSVEAAKKGLVKQRLSLIHQHGQDQI
jgi:hypothetical protein